MPCLCTTDKHEKTLDQLLDLSMIPRACQECQLSTTGCTRSESIEWLLNLKDKVPIWSRLNEINTSGFRRKLPMSMTKNFDIEIEGRLWSLWSHRRKHNMPQIYRKSTKKYYMAATVMALCAARVIRINIWNTQLMDSIVNSARIYFRKSLKKCHCLKEHEFELDHLYKYCKLESISFKINLKTVYKGRLYSVPLACQPNLAFGLKQFFSEYQFGVLECCKRVLGIGFIDGPSGGYFMYDAQSINKPLFSKGYHATYLLRTNHLQVLLYCLIITLNIPIMYAEFCLRHLNIKVIEMDMPKNRSISSRSSNTKYQNILPPEYWHVPSLGTLRCPSSQVNPFEEIRKCKELLNGEDKEKSEKKRKYRRKYHNITKEEDEKGIIKPLVDHDQWVEEGLELKKDFVRMVCSGTRVPQLAEDIEKPKQKGFSCTLTDAMFMGPEMLSKFSEMFKSYPQRV